MEVVILNDFASPSGGSSSVALKSARGLAESGVQVTLFTCVGPVAPEVRDVHNLRVICLEQFEIADDPSRVRAFVSGVRNAEAVRELRALLATKDPQNTAVHVHTYMKALSPFAVDAAISLGFPVLLTLHDFFISCPTGGFFEHPTSEICTRTPLSLDCLTCNCDRRSYPQKLWRSARTAVQNKALKMPEGIAHFIAPSGFALDVLRPLLPSAAETSVLSTPVDFLDDGPAHVSDNEGFLFIGRLVPEKGVALFASAASSTGLGATIVGDGEMMQTLRDQAPAAEFTGWLAPDEVKRHLRSARALVFPSLWYETLGIVALEAAAAGVPAIISDRCAATDFVIDGETGLHFQHGSASSLADAMSRLAGDPGLAVRLGAAAHAWYWDQPWSTERHVRELMGAYTAALANA